MTNVTKFRKGFTNTKEHELFLKSVQEGDAEQICAVLRACGEDTRMPVDALVNSLPNNVRANRVASTLATAADYPEFGSAEHTESLGRVLHLAELRDTPMSELSSDLPRGLREISPYLRYVTVPKYEEGKDYGTTKASHRKIQEGRKLAMPQGTGEETLIITGRDAAAYVHHDDPIAPWEAVVKDLLMQGIMPNTPVSMEAPFPAQENFTVYGFPFFKGLMGQALFNVGILDFHLKWRDALPRPEESMPVLLDTYLPLAYAEGSPMHPRGPAMHSGAAWVQAALIKGFWDDIKYVPMEDTESYPEVSLYDTLDLLADNIGYWRLHAGVHEEADHLNARAPAEKVAEELYRRLV